MDNGLWSVVVLAAGSENAEPVAAGEEATAEAAIEAASDAALMVAMDRGREEYWITVAGAEMMLTPGLTCGGDVDLWGVHDAVLTMASG